MIFSRATGRVILALTRGRVPSGNGVRVDLSDPAVPPHVATVVLLRRYEREELRLIASIDSDTDIVELGSGIGVVSAHLAAQLRPRRKLVCVEASPRLIHALCRAVPEATVVHAAIDRPGSPSRFAIGRSVLWGGLDRGGTSYVEVPKLTLSELLERHQINEYALVSDIEGAESAFIDDDIEALDHCRSIIIELHTDRQSGRSPEELAARLQAVGFVEIARAGMTHAYTRVKPRTTSMREPGHRTQA